MNRKLTRVRKLQEERLTRLRRPHLIPAVLPIIKKKRKGVSVRESSFFNPSVISDDYLYENLTDKLFKELSDGERTRVYKILKNLHHDYCSKIRRHLKETGEKLDFPGDLPKWEAAITFMENEIVRSSMHSLAKELSLSFSVKGLDDLRQVL